jgi:hypothetical protein
MSSITVSIPANDEIKIRKETKILLPSSLPA